MNPCPQPPTNWSAAWQHRPVLRKTETRDQQPIVAMPERAGEADKEFSELYWRGKAESVTWDELRQIVSQGYSFRKRLAECDIAVFPAISGLVIIDCDVKEYDRDTGFVAGFTKLPSGAAQPAPPVVKHGIDDLQREVEKLGRPMAELATYAVSTKSGGVHLYYQAPPRLKLKTTGHKENWRVDIVAHNNNGDRSWVAAPPTAGYQVIRDLPVAQMPVWLAEFLRNEVSTWPKPGGQRRRATNEARHRARVSYECAVTPGDRRDYYREWLGHELREVELANQHGGWNDAVNKCAWTFFTEAELPYTVGRNLLLKAAAPVNAREERKAVDTINSAWRAARPGDNRYLED